MTATDGTETTSCSPCDTIRAALAAYLVDNGITVWNTFRTLRPGADGGEQSIIGWPPNWDGAYRRGQGMTDGECRCHVPARIAGVRRDEAEQP